MSISKEKEAHFELSIRMFIYLWRKKKENYMSQFVVSARKYRPQRFDEVVGQSHVTKTLKNAIEKDYLAHALLFCGPRGIGKTTCARILAKRLNCEQPTEDNEPCNQCTSCINMLENTSFNIFEQDAASNNSVDHMRALIDQVRIPPQFGTHKIFIIDEVHMLSPSAFNAFLKTLEEPPAHATFILATTEKHKIIPTILSRCQIYDFKRVQIPDIVKHLKFISEKEGITSEHDALHTIATKADGALRDALSIFDRVVSSTDRNLTYEDVVEQLNLLDYEVFFEMTDALIAGDLSHVYRLFNDVLNNGFEGDIFILGLAKHLRDLLVCQFPATISLLEVGDNLKQRYYDQAKIIRKDFILTALQVLNHCDIHYQKARDKRLHVEMALSQICYTFLDTSQSFIEDKKKLDEETTLSVPGYTGVVDQAAQSPKNISESRVNEDVSGLKSEIKKEQIPKKHQEKPKEDPSLTKQKEPKELSEAQEANSPSTITQDPTPSEQRDINESEPEISEDKKISISAFRKGKKEQSESLPDLGDLTDLAFQVSREKSKIEEIKPDLNIENLKNFLSNFKESTESPSILNALKTSTISHSNKNVTLLVANRIDLSVLSKESNMQDAMRSYFYDNDIKIKFDEDEVLQKEKIKLKPKTNQEALDEIKEKYENVEKMIDLFNLKLKDD